MNPMYFLGQGNAGTAKHWFLRTGTSDTDTSPLVLGNLAAMAAAKGGDVDALMYWDAGHGAKKRPRRVHRVGRQGDWLLDVGTVRTTANGSSGEEGRDRLAAHLGLVEPHRTACRRRALGGNLPSRCR